MNIINKNTATIRDDIEKKGEIKIISPIKCDRKKLINFFKK